MTETYSNAASLAAFPQYRPLARAVALAFALGGAGAAQAAVINVDSAADPAAPAVDGNCTFREAVQAANTNAAVDGCAAGDAGADQITFNGGLGDIAVGDQINITEDLTITGPAAGQVLDGGGMGRILAVTADVPVTLANITVQNGNTLGGSILADDCLFTSGEGAGICSLGDLTLTDSMVTNNTATNADGGGVFVNVEKTLTVTDSTISNNFSGARGGGIFADNGAMLEMLNSTMSNNQAAAGGGALYVDNAAPEPDGGGPRSTATLTYSTVSGNTANNGGGIFMDDETDLTLTSSKVLNNVAEGPGLNIGGGIYAEDDIVVTLTNSIVSGNSSEFSTGGIRIDENSIVTLTNSTVSNNTATITGGIRIDDDGDGGPGFDSSLTLINSTVSGNVGTSGAFTSDGGGIWADQTAVSLQNSTIVNNSTGDDGGGVFFISSAVTMISTIIADNIAGGDGPNCDDNNTTVTATFSLIEDVSPSCDTANGGNNIVGTGAGFDPLLGPLADNGCAVLAGAPGSDMCVQTHALLIGSPAIDTGNDNGQTTDERGAGFPRVNGAEADIGAYEFGTSTAILTLLKEVINDHGGTAEPENFTLSFIGPNPANTTDRSGPHGDDEITNEVVPLGDYTLDEDGPAGYISLGWACEGASVSVSPDGSITTATLNTADAEVTCTVTNDDRVPPPIPTLSGWGLLTMIGGLLGLLGWRSRPRRRVVK